jgi:hypothetical protein
MAPRSNSVAPFFAVTFCSDFLWWHGTRENDIEDQADRGNAARCGEAQDFKANDFEANDFEAKDFAPR